MYYLYALFDPNLKIPKYIGITNNPKRRLSGHINDTSITKKTKWINALKAGGQIPILKIIKETDDVEKIKNWEIQAIKKYKDIYGLTNSTAGGEYIYDGKPIDVFDMQGNYLDSYSSISEYCELNSKPKNFGVAISNVCSRKRNYAGNNIFRYSGDIVTLDDLERLQKSLSAKKYRHIYILTLDGELYKEYNSCMDADRDGFASENRLVDALNNPERNCSINGYLIVEHLEDYDEAISRYLKHKQQSKIGKWICKYNVEGKYLDRYDSCSSAANSIGVNSTNNIRHCLMGDYKQAYGYQWRYSNTKDDITPYKGTIRIKKPVLQYTVTGELINTFKSPKAAADTLGVSNSGIVAAIKNNKVAYGYIWKYDMAV